MMATEKEDTMITPASVADWATFAGILGMLTGVAAIGYRTIGDERTLECVIGDPNASPRADRRAA